MDKKRVIYIIEWVIAVAACAWLVWKLATYEDYAALGECLRNMGWAQWMAIAACVALMPVNMALEAWKWKTLMNEGMKELTFKEAQRQVYYSKLAGLITPWRLGEYPARGVLMSERVSELGNEGIWPKVLSMGAVGSATMTMAIVLAGLVGLGALGILGALGTIDHDGLAMQAYTVMVCAVLIALVVGLALTPRLLRRWATVSRRLILVSLGQSLVRLACWCVQLMLVIWALGGLGTLGILGVLGGIGKSAVYYLFVTITPNVPIVEAGARGAWAMAVFGTVNAALAGVLLWTINTLLPCVIGLFYTKNNKKFA